MNASSTLYEHMAGLTQGHPQDIEGRPSVDQRDISGSDTPRWKAVKATTLLIDNVLEAGPEFDTRYEELSRSADLIICGHAGLGANIRALANKGDWREGQYSGVSERL